ncbi:hypothetical protein HRbin33_02039 [bacterium HR33]|nr:hypothetical protein HRbin33_02039 [bacterium HR33]
MKSFRRPAPGEITRLLREATAGRTQAWDELMPLVYPELKRLARSQLRSERAGHTLDTTAVVHEAYLKLVGQDRVQWQSRAHFYAVAAQAMRRILVDYARKRAAGKRGGGLRWVSLQGPEEPVTRGSPGSVEERIIDLINLDAMLRQLSRFNPRGAAVVEYRFFGGLSYREIAEVMGVSTVTVRRLWAMARAWLWRRLDEGDDAAGS